MLLVVAVVGKPRHPGLADAIAEYERRAARYWPLAVHEVKEERGRSLPPALVREREGERLAARLEKTAIVTCDLDGESMTSEKFAAWLRASRDGGRSLGFAIGGAHGLAPGLRERAAHRLSLAPWTLPHEMARLVLAEQLYRAGTIVRGEPYHK